MQKTSKCQQHCIANSNAITVHGNSHISHTVPHGPLLLIIHQFVKRMQYLCMLRMSPYTRRCC